jgi:hypothetical protein
VEDAHYYYYYYYINTYNNFSSCYVCTAHTSYSYYYLCTAHPPPTTPPTTNAQHTHLRLGHRDGGSGIGRDCSGGSGFNGSLVLSGERGANAIPEEMRMSEEMRMISRSVDE